jgi:hypothetical protein
MTKIIILFLGIGLTIIIGVFLFIGMAFSNEASRGRPGNAIFILCLCVAWGFCLLPAAAAIYKVSMETLSVRWLVLCWVIGPVGALIGALGSEYFSPSPYTTAANPESINSFAEFKNANVEFAKEKSEIVEGLFQPIFDRSGMRSVEFGRAEDRVIALAKSMGSPIFIAQEDGKGDRVFLVYPCEAESHVQVFPTTQLELKRLTSGQTVSPGLLKFLAALRSVA